MLFHSWQFWLFFALVWPFYWWLPHRWQNRWLLVASYFFYGWWDWRFLGLIILSTAIDFTAGRKIAASSKHGQRRFWLLFSLLTNLGLLGLFKYYDFFATSLAQLFASVGFAAEPRLLHLILPVGISFYTFQTLSYTIDIYRGRLAPTPSTLDFALFVAFFPQLIAGPIERATHLLPQITARRNLTRELINNGLWLFFWGMWLKVFVADGLSVITEPLFAANRITGSQTLIATWAFSWQLFADFAGYSSMARGLANLLGFNLIDNFNLPFWSQNVSEFWQRWHISLSNWVKDYIYIPLGGNRRGRQRTYLNLLITFTIMGLWHGANTTFLIWGLLYGVSLVIYRWYKMSNWPKRLQLALSHFTDRTQWYINAALTFNLFAVSMIFFRSPSIRQAVTMLRSLTSFHLPLSIADQRLLFILFSHIILLVVCSAFQYAKDDLLAVKKLPNLIKAPILAVMFFTLIFYSGTTEPFIYFAF